ncbi:Signal-transducing adaptor protein 2 [Saguinus oedipus]|uniref:Signal-transducing adaptor protein 2 n=1 Tax=Saguinus oedipus TaxID=9490 RepID=A0ABQ9TQL4_SAGOE|nr:Signal-transducing adaptor protein 2 [Saguinus oedipus]
MEWEEAENTLERHVGWVVWSSLHWACTGTPKCHIHTRMHDPRTVATCLARSWHTLVAGMIDPHMDKYTCPIPCTSGPKPPPPASVPVSSQDKLPPLPPLPPLPDQEENYVTPIGDAPAVDYENQDVASSSRPVILKPKKLPKAPAKPPKPPTGPKPEPKVVNGGLPRKLPASSAQPLFPTPGLADVTAELQRKLEKRRALEH